MVSSGDALPDRTAQESCPDSTCSPRAHPQLFSALRRNSWKSTPIEGVAGNLVIQQERPPSETVAKSPSIRLFSAFVCPLRFSDLLSPPTSGRGRFGHLLHLVDCSHANPWRKESAYRAGFQSSGSRSDRSSLSL